MNLGEPAQLRAFSGPPFKKIIIIVWIQPWSKIRIMSAQNESKFSYTQRGVPIKAHPQNIKFKNLEFLDHQLLNNQLLKHQLSKTSTFKTSTV